MRDETSDNKIKAAFGARSGESLASQVAKMPPEEREAWFASLTTEQLEVLKYDWRFWGRPKQLEPEGDWRTWLILAGRGWGKTRTGAEWVNDNVRQGKYGLFNLVGATAADIRDIMVEGPSGIIETSPPWFKARYYPTKRRVEWPNGAKALCFSADEPERLRGEQCEAAWADELAAWRYDEAWVQLMLGMRLGESPRVVVTTTPKPTARLKKILRADTTFLTKGNTYENADNLAGAFIDEIIQEYEGTRFGRQELYADILDDAEGAMWSHDLLDMCRVEEAPESLQRIVVAVDPAVSFSETSDETGIVVCGLGHNKEGYVLADYSGKYKVDDWARKVVWAYREHEADRIVAEKNQGYDLVRHTIQVYDDSAPVKLVHASRNKQTRAEPVAALYEQGRVHHVGTFADLEDQMCSWEPGFPSPDRMDALVWGFTELMVGGVIQRMVKMRKEPELQGASYWRG